MHISVFASGEEAESSKQNNDILLVCNILICVYSALHSFFETETTSLVLDIICKIVVFNGIQ